MQVSQMYLVSRRLMPVRCRFKSTGQKRSKRYADTLLLPKTDFQTTMRSGAAAAREKIIQEAPAFQGLYEWQQKNNKNGTFILHDGPPYANGKPHVGHALNKILKDITNRYHVLQGHQVHYVPGWDCHGLPIELKALGKDGGRNLTPQQVREKARKSAQEAIETQREAFKCWGIMADWNQSYFTFTPQYQANQLDVFYDMFEKGLVYQDFMPVYWSPSSSTALAEAELEYNASHESLSVYFRVLITKLSPQLTNSIGSNKKLYALVWTTCPWTVPANQMISYNSSIQYALLEEEGTDNVYVCEDSFVEKFKTMFKGTVSLSSTISGAAFENVNYQQPLTKEELPFLNASLVVRNKGTGLVHTAPAHGHDDFQLAIKENIEIKSLLDDDCRYTADAGPILSGKRVDSKEAQDTVLELLGDSVMHMENFIHSYPYDWRMKKPVIIRASRQWFVDTKKICQKIQECLRHVSVRPGNFADAVWQKIETRPYWCISRQRVWGSPIPVFYHKDTEHVLLNRPVFEHVQNLVRQHGSDCWWSLSAEELLPTSLLQKMDLGSSEEYKRGQDILDIWFDSGTSWKTVLPDQQADVYMEGHDQLGAWFQASLLTSVAVRGTAPYRNLIVHGFTLDEEGKKMSKSLGNVVDPEVVVSGGKNQKTHPSYGVDILRCWVAHSSLHSNVTIGSSQLNQVQDEIFQIRKMLRFLLGNLRNFSNFVDYSSLWPQDKYMLYELYQFGAQITPLYEEYRYGKVLQLVEKFVSQYASSFYSNIIKDRCYCGDQDSEGRLSSQTTQFHILNTINKVIAPILPHLAEEVFQHLPENCHKQGAESVFQTGWLDLKPEWNDAEIPYLVQPAFDIRDHLIDLIISEQPVEFDVMIYASNLLYSKLQVLQSEQTSSFSPLCEILQTSHTTLTDKALHVIPDDVQMVNGVCSVHMKDGYTSPEQYVLILSAADKYLCERCRRYTSSSQTSPCSRCLEVLASDWS